MRILKRLSFLLLAYACGCADRPSSPTLDRSQKPAIDFTLPQVRLVGSVLVEEDKDGRKRIMQIFCDPARGNIVYITANDTPYPFGPVAMSVVHQPETCK
jgi:hypothetical protein